MTKPLLILNDLHLGVNRQAGTTPASKEALESYLETELENFLTQHSQGKDLLILGDLFDGFSVDIGVVLRTYHIFNAWLLQDDGTLYLAAGNHDVGKRDDRLSSFGFLASVLAAAHGDRVVVIEGGMATINDNIYVIPHVPNQDLFDLELQKLESISDSVLMLHCNYDNPFTEHSDASLNVKDAWAAEFCSRRNLMVIAHEHIQRKPREGVQILGNQWSSSVADCLLNNTKCAWVLNG